MNPILLDHAVSICMLDERTGTWVEPGILDVNSPCVLSQCLAAERSDSHDMEECQ